MVRVVTKKFKFLMAVGIGILLVICIIGLKFMIPYLKPKPAPVVDVPFDKLKAFYVGSVKTGDSVKDKLVTLNITDLYKADNEVYFEYELTVSKIKSEALSYNKDRGKIDITNQYLQFGADINNTICKYYKKDGKIIIESIDSTEPIHLRLEEMLR